jgi:hypothetical protein
MLYEEITLPCDDVSCLTFSSRVTDNPTLYLHHGEVPDAVFLERLSKTATNVLSFLFIIPIQHHFITMTVDSPPIKKW